MDNNKIFTKDFCKYLLFAVLTGVIVFLPIMTNGLVTHWDGIWKLSNYHAGYFEISLGRGLLVYVDIARFGLVSGSWNSVLVFLLIGATDYLIIRRFEFNNIFFSYLFTFITIANPIVGCTLANSFTSVDYALAYLLTVLAFYINTIVKVNTRDYVCRLMLSSLCICAFMALYQAYLCVYTVLLVFWLIVLLKKNNCKQMRMNAMSLFLSLIIGGLIYYLISKLMLFILGIDMSSYKGADSINLSSMILNLPKGILKSYSEYIRLFYIDRLELNIESSNLFIICFAVVLTVFTLIGLIKTAKKRPINGLLFIVLIVLIPLAAASICLIAVGNEITEIMSMGILVSVLMFYCLINDEKKLIAIANIVFVIFAWYQVSAVENDQIALKEGINATRTIVENVLSDDDFTSKLNTTESIAFVGQAAENRLFYKSDAYKMANWYARFGMWGNIIEDNHRTWRGIVEYLCGIELPFCSEDAYSDIIRSEQVRNMPCYPDEGYIEVVDGILVVKISDMNEVSE